jgi:hypothetical protein
MLEVSVFGKGDVDRLQPCRGEFPVAKAVGAVLAVSNLVLPEPSSLLRTSFRERYFVP